jgi:hypothetical protein
MGKNKGKTKASVLYKHNLFDLTIPYCSHNPFSHKQKENKQEIKAEE